jgi:CheY-like chemotaxis protein
LAGANLAAGIHAVESRVLPTFVRPDFAIIAPMASSVLLVDDDPAFLSLATRILESMGGQVVATAEDAAAAIAAANATRPEAALVDVGLPDRDGIDLAYELAALPWRPRVVLTSTDRDAVSAIDVREGPRKLPFVPKEELANDPLRRLLLGP